MKPVKITDFNLQIHRTTEQQQTNHNQKTTNNTNQQTNKQTNKQANKQASKQAS